MNVLLDTHAMLWFLDGDARLTMLARRQIASAETRVFVSIASCWELAIKHSIGKLRLTQPFERFLWSQMSMNRFELLPILPNHLDAVVCLPHHHKDPFDRLLVAQALVEHLPVLSADTSFDAYGVDRRW